LTTEEKQIMKMKVYQWQYDEIEAAVWNMKDARKWLYDNLEVAQYSFPADRGLEYIYIFFGTEEHMEDWRRKMGFDSRNVRHAMKPERIQGLRGIPVRIYDIDGDQTWYHKNFWDPKVRSTLDYIGHMQSMCGTVERVE
jgi:hypothetical protein